MVCEGFGRTDCEAVFAHGPGPAFVRYSPDGRYWEAAGPHA